MKLSRFLSIALLSFFAFPAFSNADQLEDAKAAIQNEDFEKVYELLLPLGEENNAEAQFLLGTMYINGQGVEKDDTKGLSWTMKSARQGYDKARLRALSIYSELANQGDASAMYNLGYMYLHGWGREQDSNIGIGWLERAAKKGHIRSAKVLSGIYAKGKFGINPDEDKASFWSNLPGETAAGNDGAGSMEATVHGGPLTEYTSDSEGRENILKDIKVENEKFLRLLRMEMIRAEDLKFEIFNSLNSTDEFDITCEMYTPTGSIIPRRVCDAGFMKKAREEDARLFIDYVRGPNPSYSFQWYMPRPEHQLTGEFAHKAEALKKEMLELGIKHPSLGKSMIDEYELRQRYDAELRERSEGKTLIKQPEEYFADELKFLNFAYLAYNDGMMDKEIWSYWDKRFRSVIHQEPYRSIWLSSNTETYTNEFVTYVNRILSGG
jgi:hypothetical protein